MFRKLRDWLGSLFSRKDDRWQEDYNVYKLEDRKIYQYFNGTEEVRMDPMVLYKRFAAVSQELAVNSRVAGTTMTGAAKAHEDMIRQIRNIFDLKPFDQGGLTEAEAVELLDHFVMFCETVKKNSSPLQTSPDAISQHTLGSTVGAYSDLPSAPPVTPNSSASGSTAEKKPTDAPTPPPSGPASPSVPSPPA